MNPTTIAIARITRRIMPTIAMNGLIGYRAVMIITPIAMINIEITIAKTASTKPISSPLRILL